LAQEEKYEGNPALREEIALIIDQYVMQRSVEDKYRFNVFCLHAVNYQTNN
jgi:hypothetical protein